MRSRYTMSSNTTTMSEMRKVVELANAAGIRDKVRIMVGGAPISQAFCDEIGADIYTDDAAQAARAAAEAIRAYVRLDPCTYAKLKKIWEKYVNNIKGLSRYKNVGVKTTDGVSVYSYTQFRQYGLGSYWSDFERVCKKNGITIVKMKKIFVGGGATGSFIFIV